MDRDPGIVSPKYDTVSTNLISEGAIELSKLFKSIFLLNILSLYIRKYLNLSNVN